MSNYLIVGASSGIGAALAQILVDEGHTVYGTYHSANSSTLDNRMRWQPFDVTKNDRLIGLPEVLDGLTYCVGSINLKPFHRLAPNEMQADFDLMALGAARVLQQTYPNLKAARHASVVLFSTVAMQRGFAFHASVSMAKGAIEGLTRALAAEWAPNIRVNCVAPALTDTPLAAKLLATNEKRELLASKNPLKRLGTARDVATVAAHLLAQNTWVTGQVWAVDGGLGAINS